MTREEGQQVLATRPVGAVASHCSGWEAKRRRVVVVVGEGFEGARLREGVGPAGPERSHQGPAISGEETCW